MKAKRKALTELQRLHRSNLAVVRATHKMLDQLVLLRLDVQSGRLAQQRALERLLALLVPTVYGESSPLQSALVDEQERPLRELTGI